MKVLIVGLGSIGKRHLSILRTVPNTDIAALRSAKGTLKDAEAGVTEFKSVKEALAFQPDAVIISNPTSEHVGSALPFLEKGIKTLIEKPVAQSLTESLALIPFSPLIRVAYCLRFLPLYQRLREIWTKDRPFKLSFKRSFYLPLWHPYADYRTEYVAQKKLGGGVVRTLSHEIDLLVHWFGIPTRVDGYAEKLGFLEMDCDDSAHLDLHYPDKLRASIDLDLYSPVNINIGEAYTNSGKYTWDTQELRFQDYSEVDSQVLYNANPADFDLMYENQTHDFMKFVTSGNSSNANLDDGSETLKIIESLSHKDGH